MIENLLRRAAVIPVIALDRVADAVPLARTLAAAGMAMMEITLRTSAAIPAIRAVRDAGLPIAVAAGTVRTPRDLDAARSAGAVLAISPGSSDALVAAARGTGAWIPGAATPSEIMRLADAGHSIVKLFPARLELVDALAGPFPDVALLPTGGVDATNAADYLRRSQVIAVSGSWIAPRAAIAEHAWPAIERRARAALAIVQTK